MATENVSNPDVRDRAFIYWRMLSTDPGKTKNVVFGYRPQAKDSDKLVDKTFLSDMMKSLGYASSLFEKRADELFPKSLAELKVFIEISLGNPDRNGVSGIATAKTAVADKCRTA